MSNQHWPEQPQGQPEPWSRNDPTWHPPHFQDHVARNPRMPFGQQPQSSPIPDLEPPKKPVWPWVVGVIAVVAVVLIVLAVQPAQQEPAASEQPPASTIPSPSVTGNAVPYEGNGTGVFEITSHQWTDAGLEIHYKLTAEDGTRRFAFFAFTNETRASQTPEGEPIVEASPEAPATGKLVFHMPQSDSSIVLTTANGRAITALPIPG